MIGKFSNITQNNDLEGLKADLINVQSVPSKQRGSIISVLNINNARSLFHGQNLRGKRSLEKINAKEPTADAS
jgi:hypothetical protein